MELVVVDRPDDVSQVALVGRLDVMGLHEVDIKFHALTAAAGRPAIVDLGRLEYIASLGLGMLISCAQSLKQRGFAMVLVGAMGDVDAALRRSGLDQAIVMVATVDDAQAALGRA